MSTHLIIPDYHAKPNDDNRRADWLSKLIADVKPDVVVNIGDAADMPSLCSYDKSSRASVGRTYRADIASHLEAQDRIWGPLRRKKKRLPRRVALIGNHEQRIARALDQSHELEGTISFRDLELERDYDTVVPYSGATPGTIELDGILYAHYFISGVMGRAIGGVSPASSLLNKLHCSATCGHLHLADWATATRATGQRMNGLFAGTYQEDTVDESWAGEASALWWNGIAVKRNVDKGNYDLQMISIESLKKEYGDAT